MYLNLIKIKLILANIMSERDRK